MSLLFTGAAGLYGPIQAADERAIDRNLSPWNTYSERGPQALPWAPGMLWPSSKLVGSDSQGGQFGLDANSQAGWWQAMSDAGGDQYQPKIRGTTRDAAGNVKGSCIVKGFVTSTNAYVGQCTSDSSGYFELPTPFVSTAHYLVAYQAGSPDTAGTTVNTLTPS